MKSDMKTKLTLRLDTEIIRRAKRYSTEVGKPVSQLVADYFDAVTSPPGAAGQTTPIVASLRGSLAGAGVDESDYRRYLEEKYL